MCPPRNHYGSNERLNNTVGPTDLRSTKSSSASTSHKNVTTEMETKRTMGVTFRLFAFIATFATCVLSLSVHQVAKNSAPINPKSGHLNLSMLQETVAMNRRSYLSFMLDGWAFALAADSRPADAAQEDNSSPCTTACMYECNARVMKEKNRSKSRDQECKEQCQGNSETCRGIPPQRKKEPQLLQSKRITGLYPRWQDDF